MGENEKQADNPVGSEANLKAWKWVEPSEVEARLQKVMENQGTNHDRGLLDGHGDHGNVLGHAHV